jgi:hypothetical protein
VNGLLRQTGFLNPVAGEKLVSFGGVRLSIPSFM